MAVFFEIVENNKDKIEGELDEAIDRALEAWGLQAENHAKARCPVDTGLLRNSITHAQGGKQAAIKTYHADSANGGKQSVGYYVGTAPNEEHTMFVGSNVEYAPYVEYGHHKASGGMTPGAHFLKSAVEGHTAEYKRLIEQALKGF